MNPIFAQLLKGITPKIQKAEKDLITYLESIPLEEGETHTAIVSEIEKGTVYVIVAAFSGREFKRAISIHPAIKSISGLITKFV